MSNTKCPRDRGGSVVLVGGGLAAQRAAETLRRNGHDGTIRVVAAEHHRPYDRPPLSKQYLTGSGDAHELYLRPLSWYEQNDVELLLGERAERLDVESRRVFLSSGERLGFSQLLIATGAIPSRLRGAERYDNVHELRTLDDAQRLREALTGGPRVVVVGAGFIGQEVAATASSLGATVTLIEAAPTPLAAQLGQSLGAWFTRFHRDRGIDVIVSARISGFHGNRDIRAIDLEDGRRIECDRLVVGIGTEPATVWLRGSGLDHRGVPVDIAGRTTAPGVFAAGDASAPFEPELGRHIRTHHWEAAARQGANAARAMLGLPVAPTFIPSFWSDQHGIRINFIGRAGPARLVIEGDLNSPDFAATFVRAGKPIGALLVGRPRALPAIRR